jgi:hypothetical protein
MCFAIAYLFVMCLNHISKVMSINIVLQFDDVNELQLLLVCCDWKRVYFGDVFGSVFNNGDVCLEACLLLVMSLNHVSKVMFTNIWFASW